MVNNNLPLTASLSSGVSQLFWHSTLTTRTITTWRTIHAVFFFFKHLRKTQGPVMLFFSVCSLFACFVGSFGAEEVGGP